MKKQYIKPIAQGVKLFAEEALLAGSPIKTYDDGDNGGSEALSNGKGWSCDNWTVTDDED